ncbi:MULTISPECIES: ATP-grasp domain-containing protein [unclassified Streptomyces]|uniref:ATP-grasp domain-containing protein n=1 Tax=unclassified Streptomyces TaxID=2593676 RepID=UPI0004C57E60|nr:MULTISPECIES: ATP-grasp domain-containing protein [unclassified Streptomyces]KOV83041.1 biotin carboxylase [Streptomyces sp. NRRL WC-3723]
MTERPVVMVGFVPVAVTSLAQFQPEGSVIVVDEPDVIRKRELGPKAEEAPVVRELIAWEYQLEGAADAFYNAHPDLDPVAIAPLQEYATPFAARLAERYGVPTGGYGALRILRDKAVLRRVSRAAGILNPESVEVTGPDGVRAFMAEHPGPAVLKPANRQAALGTRILASPDEIDEAWAETTAMDEGVMVPDRGFELRMLVERCVQGREYSVELLVERGRVVFGNVTGKELYPGGRPVELGHLVPADIPGELDALLRAETERLLRAVGFGTGIAHCEWIVENGRPYLVECAGRFPGDGIVDLMDRAYRVDLVRAFWTLMKGEPLTAPLPEKAPGAAAIRFLHTGAGVVEDVSGVDEARALPGVQACSVTVEPGAEVRELRSSWDRVGSVVAEARTGAEAVSAARRALDTIQIKVRPAQDLPAQDRPAQDRPA